MKTDHTLTQDSLRAQVRYDPATGVFTWPNGRVAGNPAGRSGRLQITLGGVARYAHRLAWLYVYGRWPAGQLDHINGDKLDNRIGNLRELTNAENKQNQSKAYANNRTGLLGVSHDPRSGTWRARIMVGGKSKSLGCFSTPEQASDAYRSAKAALHPAWAHSPDA